MTTKLKMARYDAFSRMLHWVIAVGIIYATIVGYSLHFISHPTVFEFFSVLNMSLATVVTVLMAVRFIWRFFRPSVPYGGNIVGYKKGIVVLLHEIFYLIIFVVLISGFLMLEKGYDFFGIIHIPQPLGNPEVNAFFFLVHRYSCIALGGMLVLHVLAVIKHQFFEKNSILSRML
ncbi:Cytochrome b(N-terminal)/b6/petB [Serratia ficaria]|uniref:cytochrome b n=1 Tax=Serratia ficaria TaxID=61651 RepID=UPI0021786A0B|nr:cytochrome b/b6 domain-containing protein [Serratia ficaria]CAI2091934.1 Cytochrome b(N-terminal)/b6/petB [Serratia ficaria]CAI2463536.1 Cytochrome b(N-terminal)/b6/petB [Serratia ficaria]